MKAVRDAKASNDTLALREALGQLVSPYWEWARWIAFGNIAGVDDRAADAEVIAQELTAKLAQIVKDEEDIGIPFDILARVRLRICLKRYWRAHGKNQSFPVLEMPEDVEPWAGDEQQSLRRQATEFVPYLDGLPERDRELLIERLFLGLTPEQSAARHDMTRGALDVAYHRALKRLRERRRELDVREPDEGAA
ncbi:MAG: sigma factor-like helix-turn-helix DNA-binding protein [Solirubrobacteraceae bacterium]